MIAECVRLTVELLDAKAEQRVNGTTQRHWTTVTVVRCQSTEAENDIEFPSLQQVKVAQRMKTAVHITTAIDGNRLEETRDGTRRCHCFGEGRLWRAGLTKDDAFPRCIGLPSSDRVGPWRTR